MTNEAQAITPLNRPCCLLYSVLLFAMLMVILMFFVILFSFVFPSQWQCMSGVKYVMIRWFFAIYSIVFMSLSIWDYSRIRWMFALTSVNYILGTIYFIYAAIFITHRNNLPRSRTGDRTDREPGTADKQQNSEPNLRIWAKVLWFLYNLSLGTCTFVFIAFWVMLAPKRTGGYEPTLHTFLLIDRHGINLVLMIVDFLLNKIPVRLFHFFYTTLFLGLYLAYNSIYWAMTGDLIYGKILDYGSSPSRVVGLALGGGFVIVPLIQFGWVVLNCVKHLFWKDVRDANGNIECRDVY